MICGTNIPYFPFIYWKRIWEKEWTITKGGQENSFVCTWHSMMKEFLRISVWHFAFDNAPHTVHPIERQNSCSAWCTYCVVNKLQMWFHTAFTKCDSYFILNLDWFWCAVVCIFFIYCSYCCCHWCSLAPPYDVQCNHNMINCIHSQSNILQIYVRISIINK